MRFGLRLVPLLMVCGCSLGLDLDEEQERRCFNDIACVERFGEGALCRNADQPQGGFCALPQELVCQADADCDDGLFCTGSERCDATNPDANLRGCVTTALELSDGVDCTLDGCDEDADAITHDPLEQCECAPGDADPCPALSDSPCTAEAACDPETYTCVFTLKPAGEACDDGLSCTDNDRCDDAGACRGDARDESCDDGVFCNGAEVCAPDDEDADARGCVPGPSPLEDPTLEDDIDCTELRCIEELAPDRALQNVPTEACQCATPDDCVIATPADGCAVFDCDASTEFTCQRQEGLSLDAGLPCDDGALCSVNDVCTFEGECRGEPRDDLCSPDQTCAPDNDAGDEEGCVAD